MNRNGKASTANYGWSPDGQPLTANTGDRQEGAMSRERALEATQRALAALDRLQAHLAKGPPAEVTDEEREAAKAALERPEVRARVARLLRGEE